MADTLTAELDAIRERADATISGLSSDPTTYIRSQADVPRLIAAVEAVLKLHQPGHVIILGALCRKHESHRFFSITSTEAAAIADCPDCTATVSQSCSGCGPHIRLDSCPARAAITRTLTGTEQPS